MKDKSFILIIILLIISSIVSWRLYFKTYRQADRVNIHLFPQEINGWTARELAITEDEYDLLETRNVFAREYISSSGVKIYLFAVYSENNRKVSHPPEVCYTGSGVSVVNSGYNFITFDEQNIVLKANRILLQQGSAEQVAYYWFKVSQDFTSSYWKQQILIAFKSLFGHVPSSALIRVSATVENADYAQADKDIQEFIKLVTPEILRYMP